MTTIIFKKDYNINLDILDNCARHIKNSRLGLIIKRLSNSIRADGMLPERMDEHDSFFIPKNDDEKTLWDNLRASAKIQIKSIITGRMNGSKGGRPTEIKQEQPKPSIEPQKEEPKKAAPSFISPTLEEVLEYAREQSSFAGCGGFACTQEQAEEFWSYYESQEWRIGNDTNTPIRDWKPKLRQWCVKAKQESMKQAIKTIKQPTVLNLSARERQDLINKQKTEMLLKQLHAQEN